MGPLIEFAVFLFWAWCAWGLGWGFFAAFFAALFMTFLTGAAIGWTVTGNGYAFDYWRKRLEARREAVQENERGVGR